MFIFISKYVIKNTKYVKKKKKLILDTYYKII